MNTDNMSVDELLNMPAGDFDEPKFPVLAAGIYNLQVVSLEPAPSENSAVKDYVAKLMLTEDAKDLDGNSLYKGYGLQVRLFGSASQFRTAKQVVEELSMFVKSALGKTTNVSFGACIADSNLIVGKVVKANLKVKEGTGDRKGQWFNRPTWLVE